MAKHLSGVARAVALAAILSSTACVRPAGQPALDGLLRFENALDCTPGADLKRLIDSLLVFEGEGSDVAVRLGRLQAPDAYRARIGAPTLERKGDAYSARIPLAGTWRGLKVRDVSVAGLLESEDRWWIGFDAPWNEVVREANAAGFRLDREGRRVVEGEAMHLVVAVERDPAGGAILGCTPG
ncbi:hypothetical protein DDF62_07740 [Caulobacter radicis]|uniref:hypothetical protein n=1 Tax=Caulobacter radicis TaxID=2172650 RepID=UPI000D56526E|nr:hypothetical protein [Caulobacter radicis]PVM91251.1 hypothetical protein DDF62_07740 [Caulobacter radicis]